MRMWVSHPIAVVPFVGFEMPGTAWKNCCRVAFSTLSTKLNMLSQCALLRGTTRFMPAGQPFAAVTDATDVQFAHGKMV